MKNLREEMPETLRVVDLNGRELAELIGHVDHVLCGSMS